MKACARAQIEGVRCDTLLPKSAGIHDTCLRPRACGCDGTRNEGRTHKSAHSQPQNLHSQQQQQRVGAMSPMPSCLGTGGHTGGSRQGHPPVTHTQSARRTHRTIHCEHVLFFLFFSFPRTIDHIVAHVREHMDLRVCTTP